MPSRLSDGFISGSSVTCHVSSQDLHSQSHFNWQSIQNFVYFAFVYSSHPLQFDLFSKLIKPEVNIYMFTSTSLFIGVTYMFVELFIQQYTRQIDGFQRLCPLLKGLSISVLLNTTFWNLMDTRDLADAMRYLFTSFVKTEWSNCHKVYNRTQCILPDELKELCKTQFIPFNRTSAHINYMYLFIKQDNSIITTRVFVCVLLWTACFFITTVSDKFILKFYKVIFWLRQISNVLTLTFLIMSAKSCARQAFLDILDVNGDTCSENFLYCRIFVLYLNSECSAAIECPPLAPLGINKNLIQAVSHVLMIYGVGFNGVYDLGTTSPTTMIDNAVLIFFVVFTLTASIRSIIVRMLYMGMADCVQLDSTRIMTAHYLRFALLPLSTEFQRGQKYYTIYLYSNEILSVISYVTLYTLTLTKMLQIQYRSMKNVYLVGLVCIFGFIMSVPIAMAALNNYLTGMFYGMFATMPFLGGIRMAAVMYIYSVDKFSTDIRFWLGYKPTLFWIWSWRALPVVLFVIAVRYCILVLSVSGKITLVVSIAWFSLSFIIAAIYVIKLMVSSAMQENLFGAFKSTKQYGPPDPEDRYLRRIFNKIHKRECLHDCMVLDESIDCNHLPLMNKEPSDTLTHVFEAEDKKSSSSIVISNILSRG